MNCHTCNCWVDDNVNGAISIAPWDSAGVAQCYSCENKEMEEAELLQMQKSIEAAMKAGRFDCV